ncbi:ATP-binding cassette domain-containing protein [Streptomyces bathyalis]|uniref:ABC-type xenobiotic transporter n=1 Tax=Streptomyces bathyalis TaxID=2710756 RepID=A0A7T1WQR4_9ACTN|nr:ATP-binding cassette domain-containing protein [Streptomyces bathyalis]QPP07238.1 ATP-binding cassette domain-containing protein [Streptomyces bathyalis]
MDTDDAIVAVGLHKDYGGKPALAGLDLTVPRGTVQGLLGPNGAGKTTLVRILATLVRPSAGRAEVAGWDVVRQPGQVRRRIGLLGQHAALDEELGGRENLEMFGRLHHLGARTARTRAGELLERFGLADTGRKAVRQYSGGMRRRLDLAVALLGTVDGGAPDVLFLDEPTTGLDPRGRTEVWDAVRSLAGGGATVLLTTQYLEEADQLADSVAVIDGGRVVAEGTTGELKSRLGGDRIDVVVREAADLDAAASALAEALSRTGGGTSQDAVVESDPYRRLVSAPVSDRMAALTETVRALGEAGIEAEDVALRRPTLDEVFLHLTGGRQTGTMTGQQPAEAVA